MHKLIFIFLALWPATAMAQPDALDVYGVWLTDTEDAHIEITDCGDDSPCGSLIWVDPDSTPTLADAQNPDPALRERPLIGLQIISGYERGKKQWAGGRIYNPEDGKTYRSTLKRLGSGTLRVRGCGGPICRTNIWTAVSSQAERN